MNAAKSIRAALVLCLLTGPALAEEAISLAPAAEQDRGAWPYHTAKLQVQVDGVLASRVAATRLRWQLGGPTFVYPVTVAPDDLLTLEVSLAAIRMQQVYDIALLTDDGDTAMQAEATIIWPEELANPEAFIDPAAYAVHDGPLPRWPVSVKVTAFLSAAVLCAAMAAAALIRRRRLQLVVLLGLVVGSTVAGAVCLDCQPTVAARRSPDGKLLILTTRRTVQWTVGERVAPVYVDIAQAAEDSLVVRPVGVTLILRPQRAVLLRRLGRP